MTYQTWRERLGEANDPELFPLAWQDHLVGSGLGHFWANDQAAAITQIATYPSGAKVCKLYAAAGEMTGLMALKPRIEAWAEVHGCTHCMIEGRDGWRRVHPDYRHHQTIILKALAHG